MNKQFSEILERRMDRKDFLKHIGMGIVVLTGLAGVIKILKPQEKPVASHNSPAAGYGASVYGGPRQARQS